VLAQAIGATLHLVTVVEDQRLRQGMITGADHERALERARRGAAQLADDGLGDLVADGETVVTAISGTAADKLVDYATDVGADLIVVGNRRVQGIERVLGSVAVAVLRRAPCSVYVAHTA
jgi:nucleotide-binding universal stress UspA family protein